MKLGSLLKQDTGFMWQKLLPADNSLLCCQQNWRQHVTENVYSKTGIILLYIIFSV